MKEKLRILIGKRYLLGVIAGAATIVSACALFYPWMDGTFNASVEGNSRTTYSGSYATYIGIKDTYTNGCKTSSLTFYTNGSTSATVSGTSSEKNTLISTDKEFTVTRTIYNDTVCSAKGDLTSAGGNIDPSEDVVKYSYTILNNESKKIRTTTSVAPTSTAPDTVTEVISKDPVVATELELTQTSHTITCSTVECANEYQAQYQKKKDKSVDPAVVIASCAAVTFTVGAATDVSKCEKDQQTAAKKVGKGDYVPYVDPVPAEIYYDAENSRVYFGIMELGLSQGYNNYISGDTFFAK